MKRKALGQLAAMAALITGVLSGPQVVNAADAGTHAFQVTGISRIQSQCEYEWVRGPNNSPIRDELGIPQPKNLPPKCRDADNNPGNGIQTVPCSLKRNLGPAKPYWRAEDLTQAEVGLNQPCSGVLTASLLPGLQGCVDVEAETSQTGCDLDAPTWFYGYCGQTYGGDTASDGIGAAATMVINGKLWKFDKLGFTRGRGAWEFGARMYRGTSWSTATDRATARFYLTAIPNPNEPANAAGCDGGPAVQSVQFQGTIVTPAPPVKLFRTKPGWHPCADDPGFNTNNEGC